VETSDGGGGGYYPGYPRGRAPDLSVLRLIQQELAYHRYTCRDLDGIIVSITGAYHESILDGGQSLNDPSVLPFLSATLLLTFLASVITTYLIIRRLFNMRGAIKTHILTRIATILFETGLIYTLSIIASFGVFLSNSNLEYVASLAMIHIFPITCYLLLIRVHGVNRAEPPVNAHKNPELESWEGKFNPHAADEV